MADDITPPGSVFEPPLTPPPTEEKSFSTRAQRVIGHFEGHRKGRRPGPWIECSLSPVDYSQVLHALESKKSLRRYVEDKVRYDYDPCCSRLTIRMPTPLHETFCAELVDEITSQLKLFQTGDGPSAKFAREIKHFASSRVHLPQDMDDSETKYYRREPDASFGHRLARYPGVILEVSYSQKSREIPYLADDYILNTDGNIKVVVGLDIDYKMSQRAALSVWRPKYVMNNGELEFRTTTVVEAEAFRTDDGHTVTSTALRLPLRDFAPDGLAQKYADLDKEVIITSEQLCRFLQEAEARQQAETRHVGYTDRIQTGARKRRRTRTPPDDSGDDASFEERENKRECLDNDYLPGVSERPREKVSRHSE